ncbi:hypothetical protein H4I96_01485 [Botrytis cinerea]
MDGDLSIIMERAANETTLECDRFGNCFESDDVPFWLTKKGQIIRCLPDSQRILQPISTGRGQYGMHPMPPPMYDPNAPLPPTYQPPAGATKVDPSQWRSEPTRRPADDGGESAPDYEAPSGPPPNLQTNNTGASNNPFRG